MPLLRPYKIFISHAWRYSDDYYRVERLLGEAPNFSWRNLSVPSHEGIAAHDTEELAKRLRDQMRPANGFIIISGMYATHSAWIDFEIAFSRRIGRPIIGITPWGSERTPLVIQNAAAEMVGWNGGSIVRAIREHALADGD
jgi:hypothetical protein